MKKSKAAMTAEIIVLVASWRERREAKKISIDTLAAKSGVNKGELSYWERGEVVPGVTSLKRIRKVERVLQKMGA